MLFDYDGEDKEIFLLFSFESIIEYGDVNLRSCSFVGVVSFLVHFVLCSGLGIGIG